MIRAMLAVTVVAIAVSSLINRADAGSVTVNATDDIFGAGQVPESVVVLDHSTRGGSGTAPNGFAVVGGAVVSFSSVTGSISCPTISSEGCVSLALGSLNDPDGKSDTVTGPTSYTGADSISGITAPGVGYLIGVFLASGGPSGASSTALDFASGSSPGTTAFSSLSPQLDQTFFIGDGLTGDGAGSPQSFVAPAGATMLFLAVTYTVARIHEPISLVLLATGLIAMSACYKPRRVRNNQAV